MTRPILGPAPASASGSSGRSAATGLASPARRGIYFEKLFSPGGGGGEDLNSPNL